MDKKVAVILTGHLRTYSRTYQCILHNLLIPNKADLFIVTYDIMDNIKISSGEKIIEEKIDLEDVKKKFRPFLKVLKVIDSKNFEYKYDPIPNYPYFFPDRLDRLLTMLKIIYMGFNIVNDYQATNRIRYDYIIRARADLLFKQEIDINTYNPFPYSVIVPTPDTGKSINGMTLNDHIVIGRKEVMDIYLTYSEHMKEINQHIDISIVESGICYFLVNNGINIDKRYINYEIVRSKEHAISKKKRMIYYRHIRRKKI